MKQLIYNKVIKHVLKKNAQKQTTQKASKILFNKYIKEKVILFKKNKINLQIPNKKNKWKNKINNESINQRSIITAKTFYRKYDR